MFGTFKTALNPAVTVFQLVFGSDHSIVGTGLSIDNIRITGTPVAPAVPEPASLSLIGIGSIGMMALRRRRSRTL